MVLEEDVEVAGRPDDNGEEEGGGGGELLVGCSKPSATLALAVAPATPNNVRDVRTSSFFDY